MKILIPLLNFDRTGGFRVLSELANYWIKDGHFVTFLVDDRSPLPYFPTCARILFYRKNGKISLKKTGNSYTRNGNLISGFIRLTQAIFNYNEKSDLLLATHSLTVIPIVVAAPKSTKKYYYVQAYEPEYYQANNNLKNKLVAMISKLSYFMPIKQIANSPAYIDHPIIRAKQWIPPGIDKKIFYPKNAKIFLKKEIVLGVIGRKEIGKGTIYALQAFEKLAHKYDFISLKVAYGNLPKDWKHDRAEIIIPNNDSELADFYRNIDIMIAVGIVQLGACHYPVIEAMSVGTIVITTNYLPADDSNSWRVPIKSCDAIFEAVENIMASTTEEISMKVEKAIIDTISFSWEIVSKNFFNKLD